MKRRNLLQALSALVFAEALPMTLVAPAAGATPSRFLVAFGADGGWDPTSLIDPKGNAPRSDGLGPINNYAASAIKSAGNLVYAGYPVGVQPPASTSAAHFDNFFAKYYQRLLVINGIDTQTNSHESGRRFVWSGRLEEGYPSIGAIAAAPFANQPMAFISGGGYDYTAALVARVRAPSAGIFKALAYPNSQAPENAASVGYFNNSNYNALQSARKQRLLRLLQQETLPVRRQQMQQLQEVRNEDAQLDMLVAKLPATLSPGVKGQAEVALAAFAGGVAVSANINVGGFDTHANHDQTQTNALTQLLDGIDHLWNKAAEFGLQDKLTIVIGSDFGRTPFYNSGNGKDHWNVTSMMAMGAGISGNRVIGATDQNFQALKLNANTLQVDAKGIMLTPKHIHRALRDFLGVSAALDKQYPINVELLALFG